MSSGRRCLYRRQVLFSGAGLLFQQIIKFIYHLSCNFKRRGRDRLKLEILESQRFVQKRDLRWDKKQLEPGKISAILQAEREWLLAFLLQFSVSFSQLIPSWWRWWLSGVICGQKECLAEIESSRLIDIVLDQRCVTLEMAFERIAANRGGLSSGYNNRPKSVLSSDCQLALVNVVLLQLKLFVCLLKIALIVEYAVRKKKLKRKWKKKYLREILTA